MGEGALVKDFVIPPGEWTPDHGEQIDDFFENIVSRHVSIKTGSYLGTGRVQVVTVRDLPGPPKLLIIQPDAGGTVYQTLVAYLTGKVTAWTQKNFTLSTDTGVNAQNVRYRYLILA